MAYVVPGYWVAGYASGDVVSQDGTATGSVSALSIAAPTATASGTSGVVNGSASGGLAVLSLSAPSATASGTAGVINGVAAGSPSELSIVPLSAIGVGTEVGAAIGVGTPSSILISSLSATALGTTADGYLSDYDIQRIATAVIAALNATTIPVDMVKVKGQTINGSGSEADPWGP